jgi:hypothetical protein
MTPTPPKFTAGRGHEKLNRALESRILDVIGGPFVVCNRTGDTVTVSLSLDQLLPRIPKPSGGGGGITVRATGDLTRGGYYTGFVWEEAETAVDVTSAGVMTQAETGADGDACYIRNLAEVTKNTHIIDFSGSPSPYQFLFTATPGGTASDGTAIYNIWAIQVGCG